MGFNFIDILIVIAFGLLIFGPKAIQSIARSAGKGLGQVKGAKDKIMAELPLEEISKITANIPQVPLNPRQAVQMLLSSDAAESKKSEKSEKAEPKKETTLEKPETEPTQEKK